MSASTNTILRQAAWPIRRRSALITLRRSTSTGGPSPSPIPPLVETPLLGVPAQMSDTSLTISCRAANGTLIAGDLITVGGVTFSVTGQVASTPQGAPDAGFIDVPISPPVAAPIPAGTAISFFFLKDETLYGSINTFSQGLVNGTEIQAADLLVKVAAWDTVRNTVIQTPQPTDTVIFNGDQYKIVAVRPVYIQGVIAVYNLQVRV